MKKLAVVLVLLGAASASIAQTCANISLGINGSLNGFVPSAHDAWHTDISSASVDQLSDTILLNNPNDLAGAFIHLDFSIPYNVVDSKTVHKVVVKNTLYPGDSDITLAPVPSNAVVEGNPGSCPTDNNDRHLIVLDRNKCVVYEYDQAGYCNGAWSADNTALWDLTTVDKRPYGMTSADAAGLSIFSGLLRYDEVQAGTINHAIRFTASNTKQNANNGLFVAPATHASGNAWGTDNIMGMRLRLKASFDVSGFSPANQAILNAMKRYGLILADNGSSLFIQGTDDARWNQDDLANLHAVHASDFEVIALPTAYDANTAPTGPAPSITFAPSASSITAGQSVSLKYATNGSYAYIDNFGFVRGNGSVTVAPLRTVTYTYTSKNAYGVSRKSVTVNVSPASPSSKTKGAH